MTTTPVQHGFRLSSQQRRLWDLRDDVGARTQGAILIEGPLDAARLAAALLRVIDRHEALRTSVETLPGSDVPVQIVAERARVDAEDVDLGRVPEAEREAAVDACFETWLRTSAGDASRAPVRAGLLRLADDRHVYLLSMPSPCADTTSLGILFEDVVHAYRDPSDGADAADAPVQYVDYAEHQHELATAEHGLAGRTYWREQRLGSVPPIELPGEQCPATPGLALPRSIARALTPATQARLRHAAGGDDRTAAAIVAAAWMTTLRKLCGRNDVVVAVVSDARPYADLDRTIGPFATVVPIQCRLAADMRFGDVVERVTESARSGRAWGDFLDPAHDLPSWWDAGTFAFGDEERATPVCVGSTRFTMLRRHAFAGRFKARLQLVRADRDVLELSYDPSRVPADEAERLAERVETLLADALQHPERPIEELAVVGSAEHQVIAAWNRTETPYPRDACLHHLFEAHVRRAPDAIAAVCGDAVVTYRALNARANRLARHLRAHGVGPDTFVAVALPRSFDLLASVLAVVKAGGAYVPLDPGYPRERLAHMIRDTAPVMVLTHEALAPHLPADARCIVPLDRIDAELAAQPADDLPCVGSGAGVCHVMYTSGSTGTPKGICIVHRAITRLLVDQSYLQLCAGDAIPLVANPSFDASTFEIWAPLVHGARSVVIPEGVLLPASDFAAVLRRHRATVLLLTTGVFTQWATDAPEIFAGLRLVMTGGEALSPSGVRTLLQQGAAPRIVNLYGPTETTVWATTYVVDRPPAADRTVPIGRPVANTKVYVLDAHRRPVPIGVPGELYIAGDALAVGYLNQVERTTEAFVPDPCGAPGERMYRTGDVGRYRPDGCIEFLGRVDDQVKIRGFRIEPGEVEAALCSLPDVRRAAVVVRGTDTKQLVAFVVAHDDAAACDPAAIRDALARRLPEYMVPSAITVVPSLPLTPNGKVDKRALVAMAVPERRTGEPARTPVEARLAAIWEQVLQVRGIGREDNFFELGGDSILSLRVVTLARRVGIRLTPRLLLQHQTIEELAAAAAGTTEVADDGKGAGPVDLLPSQAWHFAHGWPDPNHYNMAVLLEALRPLDEATVRAAVGRVVSHHDALRLSFRHTARGWRANVGTTPPDVFRRFDLGSLAPDAQDAAMARAAAEVQASLRLGRGGLLRVALFALGRERPARLLVVTHHLVADAVSLRIVLEDLCDALAQLERGEEVALPPTSTSIRRHAVTLRDAVARGSLDAEWDEWRAELAAVRAPHLADRAPHDGAAAVEASSRTVEAALSVEETRRVLSGTGHYARPELVFLAALARALATPAVSAPLLVDVSVHGREPMAEDVDLSRTVGWLSALVPLRLSVRPEEPFEASLASVSERVHRLRYGGIGYQLLAYGADDARAAELRSLPQPSVCFAYLGQLDALLPDGVPFALLREPTGPARGPRNSRRYLLEVFVGVLDGRLQIECSYSTARHGHAEIESLVAGIVREVRSVVQPSARPLAGAARLAAAPPPANDPASLGGGSLA